MPWARRTMDNPNALRLGIGPGTKNVCTFLSLPFRNVVWIKTFLSSSAVGLGLGAQSYNRNK